MNEMALKTLVALSAAVMAAGCAATSSAPQAAGTSTGHAGRVSDQSAHGTPAGPFPVKSSPCTGVGGGTATSGQSPALAAIQFVGPRDGWVAGAGAILATSNGGRSWIRRYTGPAVLDQVDFIDGSHGWAAGGDALLRTTDGGATWTPLAEPCSGELASIHFVSPRLGYAIVVRAGGGGLITSAVGGSLARTTNGGVSWTTVANAPKNPQTVCFANASDGYLGTPGHIWRSIDGGQNWTLSLRQPRPSSRGQRRILDTPSIECAGPSAAWVLFLGDGTAMAHAPYLAYASQDGHEWHGVFEEQYTESGLGLKLPEGPGSYPGPFSAIDSGAAAFVGYTPPVGYGVAPLEMVSDRGYTLAREGNVAAINEPFAAAFLSSARGWVVGENLRTRTFSIQATTNSGRSWATQYATR
jgi:photosystem II stability/assembly factor-like uncharacterized protein